MNYLPKVAMANDWRSMENSMHRISARVHQMVSEPFFPPPRTSAEQQQWQNHPHSQMVQWQRPSQSDLWNFYPQVDHHHHLQGLQYQHPPDPRQVNLHHPIFPQDLIQDSRSENHLRNQDPHPFHQFQRKQRGVILQGFEKKINSIMEIMRSVKSDIVQLKAEITSSPSSSPHIPNPDLSLFPQCEAVNKGTIDEGDDIADTERDQLLENDAPFPVRKSVNFLTSPRRGTNIPQPHQNLDGFHLSYQNFAHVHYEQPQHHCKHQIQVCDDLKAILGDDSTNFVAWLRDYLVEENYIARGPLDFSLKAEASRNYEDGSNKEWKALPRARPPPQPPPIPPPNPEWQQEISTPPRRLQKNFSKQVVSATNLQRKAWEEVNVEVEPCSAAANQERSLMDASPPWKERGPLKNFVEGSVQKETQLQRDPQWKERGLMDNLVGSISLFGEEIFGLDRGTRSILA